MANTTTKRPDIHRRNAEAARVQAREINLRQATVRRGKAAAQESTAAIRGYIKAKVGRVPWIEHVYPCTVLELERDGNQKPTGRCLVDYGAANGQPVVALHGERVPQIGGRYALRYPSKGAYPWIKIYSGKWLYWNTVQPGNTINIYRMPWPPTSNNEIEFLCAVPRTDSGMFYRKLIGCDGQGTLWFRYSTGPRNGLMYWPENGKGKRSTMIECGGILPGAVDCTPGESNVIGLERRQATRLIPGEHINLVSHVFGVWLHLQTDTGTTYAAGPPGPTDFQWDTGDVLEATAPRIEPEDVPLVRDQAHYIPPNDGTTDAVHYHWYVYAVPGSPIVPSIDLSAEGVYEPLDIIHVARIRQKENGPAFEGWEIKQSVQRDGAVVLDSWGEHLSMGFQGFLDQLASPEEAIAYILSGHDLSQMYPLTGRGYPGVIKSNAFAGDSRVTEALITYHPHIWTDEDSNVVTAWPFIQYNDPIQYQNPSFRTLHAWPSNYDSTTYVIPGNHLMIPGLINKLPPVDPGKYLYQVFAVGPADDNTIRTSGIWNTGRRPLTVGQFVNIPNREDEDKKTKLYIAPEGQYFLPENKINEILADGRDALDLLGRSVDGKWWVTEDGGVTWDKCLGTGERIALTGIAFGFEGFIVEGV